MARSFIRYLGRHHLALFALLVALGGTSYAATALPKNSVGPTQLRSNAVISSKVKNNSLTGADVRESSLARVPAAADAGHANTADRATTAGAANAAFSRYHANSLLFPYHCPTCAPLLALYIPAAGNYVITATFTAFNSSSNANDVASQLVAAANGDGYGFHRAGFHLDPGKAQVVTLQLAFQLGGVGQAQLNCQDEGNADNVGATDTTITAVQVAQLTTTDD